MSDHWLFCFAAKSLQGYIMRGGKVRDMVGATSLIDKLATKKQLEEWLTTSFEIPEDKFEILQAAAGGGRIKFTDEAAARKVAQIWPLWCHAWAPDLDVVQHLEKWNGKSYGQVSKVAADELERNRNFLAPCMPEAGPFARRTPRTGAPAVDPWIRWNGKPHNLVGDDDFIDLASKRKRHERLAFVSGLPSVAEAFGFKEENQLPDDFEQVSGGQGAYLAVIHADGNGLGQMFLNVGQAMEHPEGELEDEDAIALFQFLSEDVVATGTREAAKTAMNAIQPAINQTVAKKKAEAEKRPASVKKHDPEAWPFAPVVLAGDDVTVVCRADLGLPFTEAFLKAFRREMRTRLGWLRSDKFPDDLQKCKHAARCRGLWKDRLPSKLKAAIPEELSAGAGVVFCTDHYPFSLSYELCESIAKHAKSTAKKEAEKTKKPTPDSAMSFVRITGSSAPTEYEELKKGILKGADGTLLTGGPYFVDGEGRPQFGDLWKVYKAARPYVIKDLADTEPPLKRGLPSSSLRSVLNLQRTDIAQVPEAVKRMMEVADDKVPGFKTAWTTLCQTADFGHMAFDRAVRKNIRKDRQGNLIEHDCSPLLDLLTLLAVRDKTEDEKTQDEEEHPDLIPAEAP